MVAFGTEIAVAKVVMEDGEELENRGVKPDEFCIPTAQHLRQEKDPCLNRALELARAAATLQKERIWVADSSSNQAWQLRKSFSSRTD
jgi:C-terminal processing protease CtpA/Prc